MSALQRRLYSVAYNFSLPNIGLKFFCLLLIQFLEVKKKGKEMKAVTMDILSTLESKGIEEYKSFALHFSLDYFLYRGRLEPLKGTLW